MQLRVVKCAEVVASLFVRARAAVDDESNESRAGSVGTAVRNGGRSAGLGVLSGDARVLVHWRAVCSVRGVRRCVHWCVCTVALRVFVVLRLDHGPLVSGGKWSVCRMGEVVG